MSNALTATRLHLPTGARIVKQSSGWTTTVRPNDTWTESLMLDVCGNNVQVICYDRDASQVMVYIGRHAQTMPLECVGEYISRSVR